MPNHLLARRKRIGIIIADVKIEKNIANLLRVSCGNSLLAAKKETPNNFGKNKSLLSLFTPLGTCLLSS